MMDYEKMYKAMLTQARDYHERCQTEEAKKELELLFPELRESEDERNIDTIFNCLYQCCDTGFISGTQRDNALAWLEKQKEKKPADDNPLDDPRFTDGFDAGRAVQKIFDDPTGWGEEDEIELSEKISAAYQLGRSDEKERIMKLAKDCRDNSKTIVSEELWQQVIDKINAL